jgi:hypothetical protein
LKLPSITITGLGMDTAHNCTNSGCDWPEEDFFKEKGREPNRNAAFNQNINRLT